jgi:GT2 family glycosyltransferase
MKIAKKVVQELLRGNPNELLRLAAERGVPHLDKWHQNWLTSALRYTLISYQPGARANFVKIKDALVNTTLMVPPGWQISHRQRTKISYRLAAIRANTGASLVTCDDWSLTQKGKWHWRQKPVYDPLFDQLTHIGSGPILVAEDVTRRLAQSNSIEHSPSWRQELITLASSSGGHAHLALPLVKAPISERASYALPEKLSHPHQPTNSATIEENRLISVLIPTAGTRKKLPCGDEVLVRNCIQKLVERCSYRNLEIVLIDGGELPDEMIEELEGIIQSGLGTDRWRLIRDKHEYTYTRRINLAAAAARGDYILQLNDDTEILEPDGIRLLIDSLQIQNVGIVGAFLVYPNGRVQHTGTSIDNLAPRHAWAGSKPSDLPWGALNSPRQFHAVTAAVSLCRRSLWQQLNGMSDEFPVNFGDVDFCLRANEIGQITIVEPRSRWLHYESASRQTDGVPPELITFRKRWGGKLGGENCVDSYCSAWRYLLSPPIKQ